MAKEVLDPTKIPGFPSAKFELIDIEGLTFDFERNPRLAELYDTTGMIENLKIHGQKTPLTISVQGDGKYLVIRGNRRGKALLWLAEFEPETYRVAFRNKITVQVYRGLSEQQEDELWVDHGDSRGLTRYEQYLASIPFIARNENRKKIGSRFGQGEGWAQLQSNILSLPTCVKEAWKSYTLDSKAGVKLTNKVLGLLYTAWIQANKDEEHPSWIDAWNKAQIGEIDEAPKVQTVKAIEKMADHLKSKEFRMILGWALCKVDGAKLIEVDSTIVKAMAELKTKAGIVSG